MPGYPHRLRRERDGGGRSAPLRVFDEVHGRVVEMYGTLKPGFSPSKEIEAKGDRRDRDRHRQDRVAEDIWIVPDMPKSYPAR